MSSLVICFTKVTFLPAPGNSALESLLTTSFIQTVLSGPDSGGLELLDDKPLIWILYYFLRLFNESSSSLSLECATLLSHLFFSVSFLNSSSSFWSWATKTVFCFMVNAKSFSANGMLCHSLVGEVLFSLKHFIASVLDLMPCLQAGGTWDFN